jgi:multiple sugar transport system ATP-binding protein
MTENVRGATTLDVEPQMIESMGSEKYVYFALDRELAARTRRVDIDERIARDAEPSKELLVARVSPGSEARRGHTVRLVVDSSKVHLFDPETEETILRGEAPAGSGQGSRWRVGPEGQNGDLR